MNKHVKSSMQSDSTTPFIIGWREWVALPDLGLPAIKAKVDTGAKTSALHAFHIKRVKQNGRDWIHFLIRPLQYDLYLVQNCKALLLDQRVVTDSGGHQESRFVIETQLHMGIHEYPIEITLTDRDDMRFRMLLGRQGIRPPFLVDASASFLLKRLNAKHLYTID